MSYLDKQAVERSLPAADGGLIFLRHWPSDGAWALVIAHGNGSHGGVYGQLASHLDGVDVYAPDLRGYGASSIAPAEMTDFQGWVDDLTTVCAEAARAGKKVALLGHSLGSLAAVAAAAKVEGLAGIILSSPSPSSKAMTPEWIGGVMELLQTKGPTAEVRLPWGPEQLVRSPETRREIAEDPLALRPVTTGLLVQIVGLASAAEAAGPAVTAPALLLLPGDDQLVERSESLRMFGWLASADKTTAEFPGCYHELPQDDPQAVAGTIARWLENR